MSEIMDDVSYLSQEIGPRPAGTEEEQQAALYIADQMQKRTGFTANIEDFNTATQPGLVEAICFGVAALVSLLAIIIGALAVPAFLITLACAILYAFEVMDRPLLSHVFERGVSQNVVARYKPGSSDQARGRKVVLVANYDSSKVQAELNGGLFGVYPTLQKASAIALVALPIIWFLRMIFGGGALFFNVLAVVALVLALLPVVLFVMHRTATYNEAANNNATGVAALMEVARIIADGSLSEEEIAAMSNKSVHSEEEAFAAGVVPEGAELEYAEGVAQSEEDRLASAKAAVAAITGQPLRTYQVEKIDFTPMSERDDIELYNEDMDYGEYGYSEDDMLTEALPVVEVEQGYDTNPVTHRAVGEVEAQATDEADAAVPAEALDQAADEAALEQESAPEEAPAASAWGLDTESVQSKAAPAPVSVVEAFAASNAAKAAAAPAPAAPTNEPAWFTTGRAKAVKPEGADNVPVRRSRYADALEAAIASSKPHFEKAASMLDEGTIERISEMQRNIEAKNAAAGINTAPLQDMLSDEVQTEEEAEVAEDLEAAAEAVEAVETETLEAAVEAKEATSAVGTETEEAADELPAESAEETDETGEAPAQGEAIEGYEAAEQDEVAPGATIAMAPIDVRNLNAEVARKDESGKLESVIVEHDFSRIDAPARRYRDINLPSFDASGGASDGPSRYGSNPLASERIPRISAEPVPTPEPISVMEEVEVVQAPEPVVPVAEEPVESIEEKRAALRQAIPSLSGEFAPVTVSSSSDEENTEVSKTGSFATASAAVPFEPVGDELVADLAPEERYVEDADDSSFEENTTETGAYAGPGYVDMPESRLSRFFSRFRKKQEEPEESTAEWLDVDESFSAREVGAARGSWESFRQDADEMGDKIEDKVEGFGDAIEDKVEGALGGIKDAFENAKDAVEDFVDGPDDEEEHEATQDTLFNEYEYVDVDEEDERSWHGGAFSQLRSRIMSDKEAEKAADELLEEVGADAVTQDVAAAVDAEDATVAERVSSVSVPLVDTTEDVRIAEETKMIYSFRNPDINTEVWFVALGAEYAGNSGMKAFLAEHADELRGAIIVNMEAMGAGQLCFIEEEGMLTTAKPSSRLKRFLRKASEITGIATSTARLPWRESAASLAMKRGLQAMTLAGIEGGKPALLGQGDDVLENIDEAQVAENAQFITEFIKNI